MRSWPAGPSAWAPARLTSTFVAAPPSPGSSARGAETSIPARGWRSRTSSTRATAWRGIPYRSTDEYLDHVFSDLAWKLAKDAALGGREALEVVPAAGDSKRSAHFETFVSSTLHEKVARAGRERIGPRAIGDSGRRRLRLVWSVVPSDESYYLAATLREVGADILAVRNSRVAVSAIPESMRLSAPRIADGGGSEAGTDTGEGEGLSRSPLVGQAILVVETKPPGASVVVGGERVGETPLSRSDLRPGSWSVVLDHPWYETIRLEGQVLEDRRVLRIDRSLVRSMGAATVLLERPVAGAWVEHGAKRREVPVTLDGLPVGPVVLTLGAPGHHDLRAEVEVPKEGVALVRRRLEPIRHGTLTVTAVPTDALVTVEGAGPYRAGMRLPRGSYRVRVSREDYLASESDVEVSGESSLRVVLDRERQVEERRADDAAFGEAKRLHTPASYRSYLGRGGRHEAEARALLSGVTEPKWEVGKKFRDCPGCPEMVVVPAGSYEMGSPPGEGGRDDDEGPVHRVTISAPFAVGIYEVTFREWDACHWDGGCLRYPRDSGWGRGERPVVDVSWEDVLDYVDWLSAETGGGVSVAERVGVGVRGASGNGGAIPLGEWSGS